MGDESKVVCTFLVVAMACAILVSIDIQLSEGRSVDCKVQLIAQGYKGSAEDIKVLCKN